MVLKASIHGPNRRKDRATATAATAAEANAGLSKRPSSSSAIDFRVRSLERFLASSSEGAGAIDAAALGDACLFVSRGRAGRALAEAHRRLVSWGDDDDGGGGDGGEGMSDTSTNDDGGDDGNNGTTGCSSPPPTPLALSSSDPILIHFHGAPVFVLRAVPLSAVASEQRLEGEEEEDDDNVMYLSEVHRHNHKVCEDTVMPVTCCSRPLPTDGDGDRRCRRQLRDYDDLAAVGVEVHLRHSHGSATASSTSTGGPTSATAAAVSDGDATDSDDDSEDASPPSIDARDVAKALSNRSYRSVLTVNETMVVTIHGTELVCRIDQVRVRNTDAGGGGGDDDDEAALMLDDPFRGRIVVDTEFYVAPSSSTSIVLRNNRTLPPGNLPPDVVHVTTDDDEWFPVRRAVLAPCLSLTNCVQAGRGKYKDVPTPSLSDEDRSPDAPTDDGCPHCRVPVDCCTFDRVLLFLASMLRSSRKKDNDDGDANGTKFVLDPSEINALSDAATALGLRQLSDVCHAQQSNFDARVRSDAYIRFDEVRMRNDSRGELLLVLDGMVLDVTRWIDEHPGGPSIIPGQALNVECSGFFEMYHASRQSFYYLKSFYIGELCPEDRAVLQSGGAGKGAEASAGFLQSLRSYTDDWRVRIDERADRKVYKSL